MINKYSCKISIDKHNNINWNINFLISQFQLKDKINEYVSNQEIIKNKFSSITMSCKLDSIHAIEINNYVRYCIDLIKNEKKSDEKINTYIKNVDELNSYSNNMDNENYYIVTMEIGETNYFLTESNIELFDFVEHIIVRNDLKNIQTIKFIKNFKNLKKVSFNSEPENAIQFLPSNLNELKYWDKSNKPIKTLPYDLNTLVLGRCFNSILNIPECNLKKIIFGSIFSQPVDNLPPTLEIIKFGYNFNYSVDNLPWSLKELYNSIIQLIIFLQVYQCYLLILNLINL